AIEESRYPEDRRRVGVSGAKTPEVHLRGDPHSTPVTAFLGARDGDDVRDDGVGRVYDFKAARERALKHVDVFAHSAAVSAQSEIGSKSVQRTQRIPCRRKIEAVKRPSCVSGDEWLVAVIEKSKQAVHAMGI